MYGDAQGGERGEKNSPSHAEIAIPGNQNGPGRTGSAESSDLSSRGIRGELLVKAYLIGLGFQPLDGGLWA